MTLMLPRQDFWRQFLKLTEDSLKFEQKKSGYGKRLTRNNFLENYAGGSSRKVHEQIVEASSDGSKVPFSSEYALNTYCNRVFEGRVSRGAIDDIKNSFYGVHWPLERILRNRQFANSIGPLDAANRLTMDCVEDWDAAAVFTEGRRLVEDLMLQNDARSAILACEYVSKILYSGFNAICEKADFADLNNPTWPHVPSQIYEIAKWFHLFRLRCQSGIGIASPSTAHLTCYKYSVPLYLLGSVYVASGGALDAIETSDTMSEWRSHGELDKHEIHQHFRRECAIELLLYRTSGRLRDSGLDWLQRCSNDSIIATESQAALTEEDRYYISFAKDRCSSAVRAYDRYAKYPQEIVRHEKTFSFPDGYVTSSVHLHLALASRLLDEDVYNAEQALQELKQCVNILETGRILSWLLWADVYAVYARCFSTLGHKIGEERAWNHVQNLYKAADDPVHSANAEAKRASAEIEVPSETKFIEISLMRDAISFVKLQAVPLRTSALRSNVIL